MSSDDNDDYEPPPFSPRQLGEMIIPFYKFLATLTFNPSHLRLPPESGWPELTDEHCAHFKTPYALETLRHLPFWVSDENDRQYYQAVETTSLFINYLAFSTEEFGKFDTELYPVYQGYRTDDQDLVDEPDRSDCILLAQGNSNFGVDIVLDTRRGTIIENVIALDVSEHEIEDYFAALREKFSSLQRIPSCGRGMEALDAHYIPETTRHITERDILNQQGQLWGTHLDLQFVRQVYRQFGWPDRFQKEEASAAMDIVLQKVDQTRRGGWPSFFV